MDRKHFKCLLWKSLWALGVLSLVFAWVTIKKNEGVVFGFSAELWFLHTLIFAVLAIPIKLDCHACDTCQIK